MIAPNPQPEQPRLRLVGGEHPPTPRISVIVDKDALQDSIVRILTDRIVQKLKEEKLA